MKRSEMKNIMETLKAAEKHNIHIHEFDKDSYSDLEVPLVFTVGPARWTHYAMDGRDVVYKGTRQGVINYINGLEEQRRMTR